MARRYVILAGIDDNRRDHVRAKIGRNDALHIVFDRQGVIVASGGESPVVQLGEHGILLGDLHTAGRPAPIVDLSPDTVATIAGGRGELLVRAYWGNYVALLANGASIHIIRAPLGAMPCLYSAAPDGTTVASEVELLERFGGYRPRTDWSAITRFAIAPDVRTSETCLLALDELRGGDRLTLDGVRTSVTTLWSPWTFAVGTRQIFERDEAVRRLRDAIVSSARSSATPADRRSAILLSGGLDSSIVAATAAALERAAHCVTVSTNAAAGDEREFARRAAGHLGLPLIEKRFDLAGVDLAKPGAARLPRPVARAFEWEARRQARLAADAVGATALLSGGGGDNIFCSLQSVVPAVDALDAFDDRHEFWRVSRELSRLTGASLATVAWRAFKRSWQRGRQYPKPVELQFLAAPAAAIADAIPRHPWLQRPADIPQGKGAHVAALLGVQTLTEDTAPDDPLALDYPLLAQPVVETCLRIPTWLWYDRGCNRAVARSAFADRLPPDIAWRRSKGTPDGFVVELYDARRAQIREMLLDGNLAGRGLLDLPALQAVLDDPRPVRGTDHGRIMRLVDIEAWTRVWPG